jgi:hypothetical protein
MGKRSSMMKMKKKQSSGAEMVDESTSGLYRGKEQLCAPEDLDSGLVLPCDSWILRLKERRYLRRTTDLMSFKEGNVVHRYWRNVYRT